MLAREVDFWRTRMLKVGNRVNDVFVDEAVNRGHATRDAQGSVSVKVKTGNRFAERYQYSDQYLTELAYAAADTDIRFGHKLKKAS